MIVFTGTAGGFAEARAQLDQWGFANQEIPLIRMEPAISLAPLESALRQIGRYAAVAITSPRAAKTLVECWRRLDLAGSILPPVWCGKASLEVLAPVFPNTHTVRESGTQGLGLALATEMLRQGVGGPVLFPCGESHREELIIRLRAGGRRVVPVESYRTVFEPATVAARVMMQADVVVLSSPRVAELLARVAGAGARPLVVAIGPTTARAARNAGLPPDAVAASPDADGLIAAVQTLASSLQ